MKRTKKEIQIEAVQSIVSGELLLEEAMKKYDVKDKRTMRSWIRKIMPTLNTAPQTSDVEKKTLFDILSAFAVEAKQQLSPVSHHYDVWQENTLLKKIIGLQERLYELERQNGQLERHRNLLLEKITSLELKVQLKEKEMK